MSDVDNNAANVSQGAHVVASDGEKLGSVVSAGADYLVVEKGLIASEHMSIPTSAIRVVEEKTVHLNVTRDEALQMRERMTTRPAAEQSSSGRQDVAAAVASGQDAAVAADPPDAPVSGGTANVPRRQ